MSMTTKCLLASLAVVATFGIANAQVMTTPEGNYLSQERYYNPSYGDGYDGRAYGPNRYGQQNYYAPPRSYYGPGTTPEGDYRPSYGYGQPSYSAPGYSAPGYGYSYGGRTTPEGDYRY